MLAVHLVTVRLLAAAWTAPEVSEEEGSYASRFYRWFSESFKSCLLLLVALPGLIDTLAQLLAWRFLLRLSMTWVTQNHTWHRVISSAQHCWPDLWHYIYYFISVRRSLYGWRKYTHTQVSCKCNLVDDEPTSICTGHQTVRGNNK